MDKKSSPQWSNMKKVFKGFTPVKMGGLSPLASFYEKGFQRFHAGEDVWPLTSCKFLSC